MKLLTLHLSALPRGSFRSGMPTTIDTATSEWAVEVEADRVLIVSPPGWRLGDKTRQGTKQTVFEVPRDQCGLVWEREQEAPAPEPPKPEPPAKRGRPIK